MLQSSRRVFLEAWLAETVGRLDPSYNAVKGHYSIPFSIAVNRFALRSAATLSGTNRIACHRKIMSHKKSID